LGATAIVAIFMAWWSSQVQAIRRARLAHEQIVEWQKRATSGPNLWSTPEKPLELYPIPWWLPFSGEEKGMRVVDVSFDIRSYDDGFEEPGPLDDAALPTIAALPHLQSLKLPRSNITDAGLAALAPLQALETLDLSGTKVTDQSLKEIGRLRNLKYLKLDSTSIRGDGLASLADCPLRELSLVYTPLESDHLQGLQQLRSLEVLHIDSSSLSEILLDDLPNLREVSIRLSGPQVNVCLEQLPALERVVIECSSPNSLRSLKLSALPQLTDVHLSIAGLSSEASLENDVVIRDLPAIKTMEVRKGPFALMVAPQIARLKSLEELWLGKVGPDFGDQEIARFASHPNLKKLMFDETGIGDAGLKSIASITSLETLQLKSERMTVAGIEALSQLPRLKLLIISGLQGNSDPGPILANFPALEDLISGDMTCRHVTFMPSADNSTPGFARLKKLRIHGANVESIRLARLPELFEAFVEIPQGKSYEIRDFPKLSRLNVSLTTGQVIETFSLSGLPELTWLSVQGGARMSEDGFDQLHTFRKIRGGIVWGMQMPPVVRERLEQYHKATKIKLH